MWIFSIFLFFFSGFLFYFISTVHVFVMEIPHLLFSLFLVKTLMRQKCVHESFTRNKGQVWVWERSSLRKLERKLDHMELRLNFLVEKASWGPRGSPHKKSGQVIFPVKIFLMQNFMITRNQSSSWKKPHEQLMKKWANFLVKKKLLIVNLMRYSWGIKFLVEKASWGPHGKSVSSWGPHEKVGQFPREKQFLMRKLMRNWNPHGETYEERKFLTKILMRNSVFHEELMRKKILMTFFVRVATKLRRGSAFLYCGYVSRKRVRRSSTWFAVRIYVQKENAVCNF